MPPTLEDQMHTQTWESYVSQSAPAAPLDEDARTLVKQQYWPSGEWQGFLNRIDTALQRGNTRAAEKIVQNALRLARDQESDIGTYIFQLQRIQNAL